MEAPRAMAAVAICFKDVPELIEQIPVSLDLGNSGGASRHVEILPRTTARAWTREPKATCEVPQ
eukprot:15148408-Heterocapsa_arctica.AAC.1